MQVQKLNSALPTQSSTTHCFLPWSIDPHGPDAAYLCMIGTRGYFPVSSLMQRNLFVYSYFGSERDLSIGMTWIYTVRWFLEHTWSPKNQTIGTWSVIKEANIFKQCLSVINSGELVCQGSLLRCRIHFPSLCTWSMLHRTKYQPLFKAACMRLERMAREVFTQRGWQHNFRISLPPPST